MGLLLVGPAELALSVGLVAELRGRGGDRAGRHRAERVRPGAGGRDGALHRRTISFGLVSLAGIGQQIDTPLVTAVVGPWPVASTPGPAGCSARCCSCPRHGAGRAARGWPARPADPRRYGPRSAGSAGSRCCWRSLRSARPRWVRLSSPCSLAAKYHDTGPAFSLLAIGAAVHGQPGRGCHPAEPRAPSARVGTAISVGLVPGWRPTFLLADGRRAGVGGRRVHLSQSYIVTHLLTARRPRLTDRVEGPLIRLPDTALPGSSSRRNASAGRGRPPAR